MAVITIRPPQLPPPNLLGAPARFDRWRPGQDDAVLRAVDSPKRFVMLAIPTGGGKSLAYVVASTMTDRRTVALTSTKALQDQLSTDYGDIGLHEIRGLNSYECIEGRPDGQFGDMKRDGYRAERGMPMMCDEAPCQSGVTCDRRDGGCLYYDANKKAAMVQTRIVSANYAYWMSINQFGEGLGEFDVMVCDEGHEVMNELGRFVGTEVSPHEVESVLPGQARLLDPGADQIDWKGWGSFWSNQVNREIEQLRNRIKETERQGVNKTGERVGYAVLRHARDLRRLLHKLNTVAGMRGEWVIEHTQDTKGRPVVKFDPVWPGAYAEDKLFRGIPKVIIVSASLTPDTATMLNLPPDQVEFNEYPSTFPKGNRPVYFFIPGMQGGMNARTASLNKRQWITNIDQIIDRRYTYKGLIHTVSYQRAREVFQLSRHRARMVTHDSLNTREVIDAFKRSREPLILVSPSITTGYDFAYDLARFQIIAKIPFPDTRDRVMKARMERYKEYRNHVTMIALIQMIGRIVRAEDDWGETFVVDSDFSWFMNANRRLVPKWLSESIRSIQVLGPPMTGAAT